MLVKEPPLQPSPSQEVLPLEEAHPLQTGLRLSSPWVWALALAAVTIRLFFWAYTGRVWEDALITVLHSENAVSGLGLTLYHPGEPPVHGFTSPLSVLVPLVGDLVHLGFGLSLIKIVSVLCSAATIFLAILIARHPALGLSSPLVFLVGGYLAIEHHQILFGMAGMETQIVVTVMLFSIYCLLYQQPRRLGLALGLCMLARPDLAFWAAIVGLFLLYEAYKTRSLRPFLSTVAVATVVYGPWVAFTTLYYGNPIPNTIFAKSLGYVSWWSRDTPIGVFVKETYSRLTTLFQTLGPSFGGNGTGFVPFAQGGNIARVMLALFVIGALVALKRGNQKLYPLYAFVLVYAVYYVYLVPIIFGWYCMPLAAVTVLLAAYGIESLARLAPKTLRQTVTVLVTAAYLTSLLVVLPTTFTGEKNIQQLVERPVRQAMGLYLGQVMAINQTIGAEPLGYLAYYSRRPVYDYPGLASRRVVDFLRDHPNRRRLDHMLNYFRPDYIALRTHELELFGRTPENAWLKTDYTLIKTFEIDSSSRHYLLFPERNIDLTFYLFKKKN